MKHFSALFASLSLLATVGANAQNGGAFADGTYYLYDATHQVFLSRGAAWGTETTADKYGIPVKATFANDAYTLSPTDWNGNVYINDGVYTDGGTAVAWTATSTQVANGFIFSVNGKYMTHRTGPLGEYVTKTDNVEEATVWTLKTTEERNAMVNAYTNANYANVIAAADMSNVTPDNFLAILASNYGATTAYTIAPTDYGFSARRDGSKASNGSPREVYQGTGRFAYTIEGVAKGLYKVTIPAFYRNGSNAWCVAKHADITINSNAYIVANGEQARIKGWAEERVADNKPNSVSEANAAFADGKYANEVYCYVGDDGKLELAVDFPNFTGMGWGIFGTTTVTRYADVKTIFDLSMTEAQNILNEATYVNVSGNERTNLESAVNTYANITSGYEAATAKLQEAIDAFKQAAPAYNDWAALKQDVPSPNTLPYAAASKLEAMTTAVIARPATAAEATAARTALQKAIRAAYESQGKAEGVASASQVYVYDFTGKKAAFPNVGEWTASQGGGNLGVLSAESWTDSEGNHEYGYFDYYNGSANNQHATKTLSLEAGKYLFTVKSRAAANMNTHLRANGADMELQEIGNQGGVFGRGWNDYSLEFTTYGGDVTLEWYCAQVNHQNVAGWAGFGDVRLMKLSDLQTTALSVTDAGMATYCGESDLVLAQDAPIAAYKAAVADNTVTLTRIYNVAAGEGVLLRSLAGGAATANAYVADGLTKNSDNAFVGVTAETAIASDATTTYYVLANQNNNTGFFAVSTEGTTVRAHSAYLPVSTQAGAKGLNFVFDGTTTGVSLLPQSKADNDATYNLAGQRVGKSYKGVVIKNGKKYIVK